MLHGRRRVDTPNGSIKRVLRIGILHKAKWPVDPDRQRYGASSGIVGGAVSDAEAHRGSNEETSARRREAVWRAYFSNDRAMLEKLIPEETIAINANDNNWENRNAIFAGAAQLQRAAASF